MASSPRYTSPRKLQQKGGITIVLIGIIILGAILLSGSFTGYLHSSNPDTSGLTNAIPVVKQSSVKNSLQLKTIIFITPTPTTPPPPPVQITQPPSSSKPKPSNAPLPQPSNVPGQSCIHEQLITNGCICGTDSKGYKGYQLTCQGGSIINNIYDPSQVSPKWCNNKTNGDYCIGKPVIYLYPKVPTLVNVHLTIPGQIIDSIPNYPNQGWKDVLASPDGSLLYQNKQYSELYYESSINKVNAPTEGIIIPTSQLKEQLSHIVTQLGLLPHERQEFLDYWLPQLYELHSPYIWFSILAPEEKERIDSVDISPKPDTMIEFIAYFKPISTHIPIKPLILPSEPPKRHGFTAVEWGGTIDTHYIK